MTTEQAPRAVATAEERPTRFDPVERELVELRQRVTAFMRGPFAPLYGLPLGAKPTWAPTADAYETAGSLVFKAELPGVKQADISVTVERGMLTIAGTRTEANEEANATRYASERFRGSFARSFALPNGVDVSTISTSFRDGVLDVRVPLPAEATTEATTIPVTS